MQTTLTFDETDNCPTDGKNASIHARVLHEACVRLGGEEHLAAFLGVPAAIVHSWLKGRNTPPDEIFLKCLDLLEKEARK